MNDQTRKGEPSDEHLYSAVMFRVESLKAFINALTGYVKGLDQRLREAREELGDLLTPQAVAGLPEAQEGKRVGQLIRYLREQIQRAEGRGANPYALAFVGISHGAIRLIKAAVIDQVRNLRRKRDESGAPAETLAAADLEIARIEGLVSSGVFSEASAAPLMGGIAVSQPEARTHEGEPPREGQANRLSFHVLDAQLSDRCLDLLLKLAADGRTDRFDTVLQEAGKILEVRLREVAAANEQLSGVELVTFALGGTAPPVILSQVPAEQEAAHLLFRGVFGFLRNPTHHRLLGELALERVIQQLGLIDYLLGLLEGARRDKSPG
jgi:hypothetical protein